MQLLYILLSPSVWSYSLLEMTVSTCKPYKHRIHKCHHRAIFFIYFFIVNSILTFFFLLDQSTLIKSCFPLQGQPKCHKGKKQTPSLCCQKFLNLFLQYWRVFKSSRTKIHNKHSFYNLDWQKVWFNLNIMTLINNCLKVTWKNITSSNVSGDFLIWLHCYLF